MQTHKTILIVEDNPINLKLLRDILNFQKFEVLEAVDGKSALELVEKNYNKIDLILMDLQLPDINGLEVIKNIKADAESKDIPIIVVSAHAMESDMKKCREAGCIDYITKPINIQEFINKINSFFLNC
ncbi:MAG TPA: two-component system response regulator [Cyanobacteria bacterium UBA9971]|nr:two-component system response regulator [Cyanobacteria bacterium UBA9971]